MSLLKDIRANEHKDKNIKVMTTKMLIMSKFYQLSILPVVILSVLQGTTNAFNSQSNFLR